MDFNWNVFIWTICIEFNWKINLKRWNTKLKNKNWYDESVNDYAIVYVIYPKKVNLFMIWLVIHVSLSNLDIIVLSWNLFYIEYRKFSTLYTFTVNLITIFIFSFCDLHLIVSCCYFKKKILHFIGIYSKYAHQCGDPKILQSPLSIDSHFSLRVFS